MSIDFESDLRERLDRLAREAVPSVTAELDRVPAARVVPMTRRRMNRRAVFVGALAAVIAATLLVVQLQPNAHRRPGGVAVQPPASTPGWTKVANAPLSARAAQLTAYTGSEVIVWGGSPDGADGVTPTTTDANLETPPTKWLNDGAVYNVAANSWRKMSDAPIAGNDLQFSVWTGKEMIVVAGASAAAYDPEKNAWRAVNAPPSQCLQMGTWANERLVAAGNCQNSDQQMAIASYVPALDKWTTITAPSALNGVMVGDPALVSAGGHALLWGYLDGGVSKGFVLSNDGRTWEPFAAPATVGDFGASVVGDAHALYVLSYANHATYLYRYDFTTNSGTQHSTSTLMPPLLGAVSPVVDNGIVVWPAEGYGAGATPTTKDASGVAFSGPGYGWFDSTTGVAGTRADAPIRLDRGGESVVALGNGRFFVWGGRLSEPPAQEQPDGAIFTLPG